MVLSDTHIDHRSVYSGIAGLELVWETKGVAGGDPLYNGFYLLNSTLGHYYSRYDFQNPATILQLLH